MTPARLHLPLFLAVTLGITVQPSEAIAGSLAVRAEEFGTQWPLTMRAGNLSCDPLGGGMGLLWFTPSDGRYAGQRFALNGLAMSRQRTPQIELIWRVDESIARGLRRHGVRFGSHNPPPRISMAPLTERGLSLCRQ